MDAKTSSRTTERRLRTVFRGFPRDYSLAPLWCWNDDLDPDEIYRQMREMKRAHVAQAVIFPMAGLTIPYLSTAYFDRFRFAVRTAECLNMRLWIYDDYGWPSGVAGGLINKSYPEYLMSACRFFRYALKVEESRDVERGLPEGFLAVVTAICHNDGRRLDLRASSVRFTRIDARKCFERRFLYRRRRPGMKSFPSRHEARNKPHNRRIV